LIIVFSYTSQHYVTKKNMETKKAWVFHFRPSLPSGLRIASVSRISNAVSPRQVILYRMLWIACI